MMERRGVIVNQPENILRTLNNPEGLPAIPHLALEILSLDLRNNNKEGIQAIYRLIDKDPVLLTRIINICNSHLFGSGRKITKLEDAVTLLGSTHFLMLALSVSMMSSLIRKPAGQLNIQSLWKHSLGVALTMDTLARYMPPDSRPPDGQIYLAGLLHDFGFLVLDYVDPQLSDEFHARLAAEPNASMDEIEAEMLGIDHGELGAMIGKKWNLPEPVIAAMNYHHVPEKDRSADADSLVALANLAEKMLPTFGFAESPSLKRISDEEWQSLGIDSKWSDNILAKVQKIVMEVATIKF
jgi:HD-like signal output (HDOD) protein